MTVILVKLPDKGVWRNPKDAEELIDTWGCQTADEAIATAQRIINEQGEVGDSYEILEVTVNRRVVVRAERVGVVL